GAGDIDSRWDRHAGVFVEGTAVEHHDISARAQQLLQLLGPDVWGGVGVLDEFTEGFARHINAGEQLKPGSGPGGDAAVERGHIRVAESRELPRRTLRQAVVIVDQYNARRPARHQRADAQLEPA